MAQFLHSYTTIGKTIALTIWTLLAKWFLGFFHTVYVCHSFSSREQVSFNFMAAVTICSDIGAQENEICHCFHFRLNYKPWNDGTGCHDLSFWMLSFKPAISLSSLILKRSFSSSSLSTIRVVSSTYLRSLIFLLAILIPACASFTPAFHMIYSS